MGHPTDLQKLVSRYLGVEQEREELAFHLLPFRNSGDTFEERFVAGGANTFAKCVDQRCAARTVGAVFVGAVDGERVVE